MMRTRAATLLLITMVATVALRSSPVRSHATPTQTCRQAQAEGDTPYAAPQHEGRALQDLVSRANAWRLAVLPVNDTGRYARVIEIPPIRPRHSPWTPRQHVVSKRDRIQPEADDPA